MIRALEKENAENDDDHAESENDEDDGNVEEDEEETIAGDEDLEDVEVTRSSSEAAD
jgi:hypothetical protein